MEIITSRKNTTAVHIKKLGASREYRCTCGEFLCDGIRLLREAVACGSIVTAVFIERGAGEKYAEELRGMSVFEAPCDILDYVSPLKTAQDVLFACKMPTAREIDVSKRNIVLDGIGDPGNVGTIIRSAAAFGFDSVILTGACADVYNPKTVRATMGAVFRMNIVSVTTDELEVLVSQGLELFGAALDDEAPSLREADLRGASVAIGSEGAGISSEVLALCKSKLFIPMEAGTESLNAAIAASVIMWEMSGSR